MDDIASVTASAKLTVPVLRNLCVLTPDMLTHASDQGVAITHNSHWASSLVSRGWQVTEVAGYERSTDF
jgi:hypothetical protein